jgi:hypothetical protein
MDHHDSRMCPSAHYETSSLRRQQNRGETWLMTMGLFVAFSLPMWAVAAPPKHANAVFMDGEVTMIHIDEVIPGKSRFAYFLHPKGGKVEDVVEMIFEGEPPGHLRTGKKVKIKGKAAKGKVWVSEVAALDGDNSTSSGSGSVAAAATGDRKTITFVINMTGVDYSAQGASPYTQIHVNSSGLAMHDPVNFSVNSAYEEASFGQVTFSGSTATDVFLVSVPYDSAEACAFQTIASQADAVSPVSLNGYRHKMYVVPPKAISGCGWLALGEVGSYGSTSTRKSWSTRIDAIAFAHELGHNIGWHHAATDPDNDGVKNVEYGDTSDLMGYCCSKRKLNSVHADQAGWFDHVNLQDRVVEVTSAGQYTLAPLGTDPSASNDPQILTIIPTTGRPYYLSYRQKTGMDAGMSSTYTTGVNIHRGDKSNNWSYFVKVLKSDFSDSNLYEFHDAANEIMISQVENNASYVTIDVSFGGECVVGGTQVTLAPSSQEVNNLTQTPSYTVNITNNDNAACSETNYQVLLASVKDAAGNPVSGITGTVQKSTVNVGPQGQGSTQVTMGLNGVSNGFYTITLDVSDQNVTEPLHVKQAMGSLNVNVPVCVVGAPTVSMTPTSQVVTEDSPLQPYNVTVTNNDSSVCQSTDWSVGLTSAVAGGVTDQVLNVGPGTSGMTTLNMNVDGVANGVYPITVNVTDSASADHGAAQVTASLELSMGVCVIGAPTLVLTPSQQLVSDVNDLQAYMLKVTNNDSAFCNDSSWAVAVSSGLGSLVVTPLNVAPDGFVMTAVNMNVAGAVDGSYPITVAVSDGKAGHAGQIGASLQLDLNAPTSPAGVAAQLNGKGKNKSVQVSWSQASDGSGGTGVVSYSVYRNGIMLGSTTSLNYKDSNFSTTVPNVYEVYAVDQVGHISATPGTVTYTYSGGGGTKGGGKVKKR